MKTYRIAVIPGDGTDFEGMVFSKQRDENSISPSSGMNCRGAANIGRSAAA
jgi:hypothetical protein